MACFVWQRQTIKNLLQWQLLFQNPFLRKDSYMAHVTEFERYAIFANGGKQYQAIEGVTLQLEKIEGEVGQNVEFSDVLFRKLGDNQFEIGQPTLKGAIKAVIIKHLRGEKKIIFRFRRRNKYRVKKGHRQNHTVVRITEIGAKS